MWQPTCENPDVCFAIYWTFQIVIMNLSVGYCCIKMFFCLQGDMLLKCAAIVRRKSSARNVDKKLKMEFIAIKLEQ
jgi:hypothetical protein